MDTDFQLKKIRISEAPELSVLCCEIYKQYYPYLWYDAGTWYQQTRYSADVLREELAHPQSEFYWIRQREQPVGYIKINLNSRPQELHIPLASQGLEVERIYLHQQFAGKGLGQKTLTWVEKLARQLFRDFVFLYTMDSSPALWFYEKTGYQKAATKRLCFEQMKPEYRGMYLMLKKLQ